MKRIFGTLTIALVLGALALPPGEANAQGACDAAAAYSVGLAGAGAIGGVGERVTGLIDRMGGAIEQAGGDPAAQPGGEGGSAPARPTPVQSNEPAPAPTGC